MSLTDSRAALAASFRRSGSMTEAEIGRFLSEIGQVLAGTATVEGEGRAVLAALAATLPLLTDGSIKRARGVLVDVAGGQDLTKAEVGTIIETIHQTANPEAEILIGPVYDGALAGAVRVTVFATGFDE
jgi:cell division protein FtsZ